jgi:hypothetical protein
MDRYYDIDPSNGRYSEEKSHHIRERYTSSSRRHRHTAPRAAGKGAWARLGKRCAVGAQQKAA